MRIPFALLSASLFLSACSASKIQNDPASSQAPAPQGNESVHAISPEQITQLKQAQELREEGLRMMYAKDPRVKNTRGAYDKLLESANLGDPLAMDSVGGFHASGTAGVEKSCAKAMNWFERSAAAGYGLAANNLAYLYVTCDDKKLRDASKAEAILKLMFVSNPSLLAVLDTYAAMHALQGNFKVAAASMEVVIELQELMESNPERIDESKKALALYKKKKTLDGSFAAKPEINEPLN